MSSIFFFFNDTATTEIYTLSLHDALPISTSSNTDTISRNTVGSANSTRSFCLPLMNDFQSNIEKRDRKSTRLNSSHSQISYAVFCLKKKRTHKSTRSDSTTYITRTCV